MSGIAEVMLNLGYQVTGSDIKDSANAEALVEAGAAHAMPESEFTAEALSARLESLLRDGEGLSRMAARSREHGKPKAHARLADIIETAART